MTWRVPTPTTTKERRPPTAALPHTNTRTLFRPLFFFFRVTRVLSHDVASRQQLKQLVSDDTSSRFTTEKYTNRTLQQKQAGEVEEDKHTAARQASKQLRLQ
jgi:hypothetical protein